MQSMLKARDINMYSTFTTKKAAIVERFNRTLKNNMWKQFTYRANHKFLDILQRLVDEYNNSIHRTIRMKPNDVNHSIERHLLNTVYRQPSLWERKPKFEIGDFVRISKYKHVFSKGYTANWTTEIFRIRKIQQTTPITYLLVDYSGENINGTFYAEELKITKDSKLYLIERIIRKKGNKVYVKWLGFGPEHNSWIKKRAMMD